MRKLYSEDSYILVYHQNSEDVVLYINNSRQKQNGTFTENN